jgi:hypothetical protein
MRDREKGNLPHEGKCTKIDIKLKHNSMNIIAYPARHNEHVASPEPPPPPGRAVKPEVNQSLPRVQGRMVPTEPTPWLGQ